jgi:formyltetrahydrofolate deformylase
MRVILTATGPDNWGLADPIVHYVTATGATLAEIQMFDHDEEQLFAMLVRLKWPGKASTLSVLREKMDEISRERNLSIRVWCRDEHDPPARLAICTTYRLESATTLLQAMAAGTLKAVPAVMIGNRPPGQKLAQQFGIDWHMIGDGNGNPDNERMVELIDRYRVDYIVLARYMRLIPPSVCWKFAGGRIINLHHGLLPAFPGPRPYHDAFSHRMLTYGATVHFIVPELDAGNQIINQDAFTVPHGMPVEEIIRIGEREHEPGCLLEGLRRVVDREVELHFNRVVAVKK